MTTSRTGCGAPHGKGRRAFLQSLGVAGALAPLVPLLTSEAQAGGVPKRLVLFFTPHGVIYDRWRPRGSGTDFELHGILAPLARHRAKLVVLGGMDLNLGGRGFGMPHTIGSVRLWTGDDILRGTEFSRPGVTYGWNVGPSVDQVIAARVGDGTRFRSLEFGAQSIPYRFPGSRTIYAASGAPKDPETNPSAALARIFAAGAPSPGPGPTTSPRSAQRRRILELTRGQFTRLETAVASRDRARLEAHRAALAELESTLVDAVPTGCAAPSLGGGFDAMDPANLPLVVDAISSLVSASMTCDLTRVASIQVRHAENDSTHSYPWLDIDAHHDLSHDSRAAAIDRLAELHTFYAEKFANLLDRLDAVIEPDGSTLLDHTMVIWGSEVGVPSSHDWDRTPFIVAGGGARGVRSGRFLDHSALEHNRLLVSACKFMGLDDIETFGQEPHGGRGAVPGLLVA